MPARHNGTCPGCNEKTVLTRHHLLPVRHFGKGKHNEHIALLCAPCHAELEVRIPTHPVLPKWQYFAILAKYLKDKHTYRKEAHNEPL